MSLWRIGRGWPEETLKSYLADLADRGVNFTTPPEEMVPERGWKVDGSYDLLGVEPPGPPVPGGLYESARQGIINYDFSDPRIVEGHFDPEVDFSGRNMLLEIKCFGIFRYLGGVRVHSIREEQDETRTLSGFRYDTLEGHFERGFEWFLLTKTHLTGEIHFRIEAHWQLGQFPNWWSRLGFRCVGEKFRERWRHAAPRRLRELARKPVQKPVARPGELAHRGDPTSQPTEPATATRAGRAGD